MRRFLLCVALFLSLASPVCAWSDAGHKIIASIAFSRLTDAERDKVIKILVEHPRFRDDFLDKLPEDIESGKAGDSREWMFQQAAIWPDLARAFRGEDAKYHHSQWHYINAPFFLNDADKGAVYGTLKSNASILPSNEPTEGMNVVQTILFARAILIDPKASKEEKGIMLSWLFHVVGDLHQPLHSVSLYSRRLFRDGDRGGNRILTKQHGNLHAVWDRFPGGKIQFKAAQQDALKLMAEAEMATLGETSAMKLKEMDWLRESIGLAVNVAYSDEILGYLRNVEKEEGGELQPIDLPPEYLREGGRISKERVIQAGYRLAAVLKQIVD